jgi:hypothetical protein
MTGLVNVSTTAIVAAATKANMVTSSIEGDFLGIRTAQMATAKPTTQYLMIF